MSLRHATRLIVIDLRALQFVRIIDIDRLPLREEINGRHGRFAMPVPGLLGAAERQMSFRADGRSVDVNNPGIEILDGSEGPVYIAGVNGGGKSIGNAIGHFNSLLEAVDRNHGNHWAE